MSNWILAFAMVALISTGIFAQNEESSVSIEKVKTIDKETKAIYTDVFNNLLIVTTDDELIKYDIEADSTYSFSLDNNFTIDYVDANNALNILLFSKDLNKVVTVDRNLRQTSEYDLFGLDDLEVGLVCLASDDNLWIYDIISSKLLKNELIPTNMIEKGNKVYINDPANGIHIFNNFGQPDNTFGEKGITSFTIDSYKMYYPKGDFIFAYIFPTSDLEVVLPISALGIEKDYKDMIFSNKYLFVQTEKKVLVYTTK